MVSTKTSKPEISDAKDLFNICNYCHLNWSESQLTESLKNQNGNMVLKHGNRIIGFVIGQYNSDQADIHLIAMRPEYHRRGHASNLFNEWLSELPSEISEVFLEVSSNNKKALGFYKFQGFSIVDTRKRYYKDGSDAIIMKRSHN